MQILELVVVIGPRAHVGEEENVLRKAESLLWQPLGRGPRQSYFGLDFLKIMIFLHYWSIKQGYQLQLKAEDL